MRLAGSGLPVGHNVAVEPVEETLDPLWHVALVEHLLRCKVNINALLLVGNIQGDHSCCSLRLVDIKTKDVFRFMLLILKRNICFDFKNT